MGKRESQSFCFFPGIPFFFLFFTNSVKWQSETHGLGFSIQQCDTRLWIGRKQICFPSVAEQGLFFMKWHGFLYTGQFRKKCQYMKGMMEKRWGRKIITFFFFFNGRHITWSFWSLIFKCFAPFFWLNWKAVFWRILGKSLAPLIPIDVPVLMAEEAPSFPLYGASPIWRAMCQKVEKPTCMQ